jgi:hypothetical protein
MPLSRVSDPDDLENYLKKHASEFFVKPTSACNTESADELFEIDHAVLVLIKDVEDEIGKLFGIAKGEKLLVNLAKFRSPKLPRWTVLQETFIPIPSHFSAVRGNW